MLVSLASPSRGLFGVVDDGLDSEQSLTDFWLFGFQGGPVEILPFLYLGSAYHASRKDMLDALGITALINVSANCPNHFEGHYQYKSIPVEDNHKADISSWFNEAIDFIGK